MQKQIYFPSSLRGVVKLPASKSLAGRALVISVLASGEKGTSLVEPLSDCDDTQVMLRALAQPSSVVDIHAAGTAMRFLTALFSVTPGRRMLTGTPRMQQRPIGILVDALRSLGATLHYEKNEGFPPLTIEGKPLCGGEISLPADVSSQYISALLMIGPTMGKGLRLHLDGTIVSRPYIDMTLGLMRHFGAHAEWTDAHSLYVSPTPYVAGRHYSVEGDWSGASYWYEMVALSPDPSARLFLPGLHANSWQGDAEVRHLFEPLGVVTTFTDGGVVLMKGTPSNVPVRFDLNRQPDLAQTLVVSCALAERPFHFTGLQNLKIKETDRIAALRCEMAKLGYIVREAHDAELYWEGERCAPTPSPIIATYDDHRMAMSFAPAAYRFPGLRIDHPEVVSKSYPAFWEVLAGLGADLADIS